MNIKQVTLDPLINRAELRHSPRSNHSQYVITGILMKKIIFTICIALSAPSFAETPSEKSLTKLLEVTKTQQFLEQSIQDIDTTLQSSMRRALLGKAPTQDQVAIAQDTRDQIFAVLKEELSWERMKKDLMSVYAETFTQEEVDGILAFYETKAGKALLNKIPTVIDKNKVLVQERLVAIRPLIDDIREEMVVRLQALEAQKR